MFESFKGDGPTIKGLVQKKPTCAALLGFSLIHGTCDAAKHFNGVTAAQAKSTKVVEDILDCEQQDEFTTEHSLRVGLAKGVSYLPFLLPFYGIARRRQDPFLLVDLYQTGLGILSGGFVVHDLESAEHETWRFHSLNEAASFVASTGFTPEYYGDNGEGCYPIHIKKWVWGEGEKVYGMSHVMRSHVLVYPI